METIRAVIIDDEVHARDAMLSLLREYQPNIKVCGQAGGVNDALETISRLHPDLLFLDIDMGEKSGFDLLDEIIRYGLSPTIIFVSAYPDYSIKALRYAAFDFLVKPVIAEELRDAIRRLRCHKANAPALNTQVKKLKRALSEKKIQFNTESGSIFFEECEIFYLESAGNYSAIFLCDGSEEIVSHQLGQVGNILKGHDFVRISRNYLINRRHIHATDRRSRMVVLKCSDQKIALNASRTGMGRIG